MHAARILWSLLIVLGLLAASVEGKEPAFPERVKALLASPWTEITATTALVTDYGSVFAGSVTIKRASVEAEAYATSSLSPKDAKPVKLSKPELAKLLTAIQATAHSTFEYKYPAEILAAMPRDEAERLIRSGKLKVGPSDVEWFLLKVKSGGGDIKMNESGPFEQLQSAMLDVLELEPRELRQDELKAVLGRDPYEIE